MTVIFKKFRLTFTFLLLLTSLISKAQVDTTFWFVAPEVSSTHADRPIYFQIATLDNPSTVNISIPAAGITMVNNVTIPANSSQSFDVTSFITNLETPNASINQVLNKGVLITATDYITVYYEVLGSVPVGAITRIVNTDIFALKGVNALGTEFYVPFQNKFANILNTDWGPIDVRSTIDIVATEDNTTITIYPTQPYRVGASGSSSAPISITLNRGQTYTIEAKGNLGSQHLSGTRIVSDKKIAVTMKDDSIGETTSAYDLVGDQIIPVERVGSEYIVFSGHAFITATEDNTTISKGGADLGVSLLKGQTYEIDLTTELTPVYIVTSNPAYMNHLVKKDGEMGGAVMPPLQCTGSTSVTVNRSSANYGEIFYLYITVEQGSEDDFVVTNSLFPTGTNTIIDGADFQPVPGTGGTWLFDTLAFPYTELNEIPLGGNTISNTTGIFHLGIMNGKGITPGGGDINQASGFRYGYFTDFGNLTISLNIPDQCITQGDSVQIYPGDFVKYDWSTGSTDTAIYVKQSGNFSVTVENSESCRVTEDFHVQLDQVPEFDLGPDIIVCGQQEVVLRTYNSNFSGLSNVTFSWDNGGTDSIQAVYESGTYTLTATNGCGNNAESIDVHMIPITTNNLFTPNGDGLNETFVLDGLDVIGEWELIIYNRWGERVYKADLYKNEWNGLNVIEGVYYYYFKDKTDQCPEKKGWVQIVK